ncbi:MAG: pyrroline-5-carboxylate reductase [Verrucomicrobiota bacterium]|nr:pyrroline-5-carboxylate reductase [Verrucomicrobiota bacterium]
MKYGFIGCGKMAGALVRGIVQSAAVAPADIVLSDAVPAAAQALAHATGANALPDNAAVAGAADALVLCVKPEDAPGALSGLDPGGKLVISIVGGMTLAALEKAAGPAARVVRVMPNTPSLVHQGAAAFALGTRATEEDANATERVFGAVGKVVRVKEPLMDAVTGLSGSGPAYVYLMIEALADGGVLMGLPRELALPLAAQTVAGAAAMVLQTGQHPALLREMVTSPGGTTIAGLEALEARGVRGAFLSAVRAATERARELGCA